MGAFADLIARELARLGRQEPKGRVPYRELDRRAARMGFSISYQTWSNWEQGTERPRVDDAERINGAAAVLGISVQTIRDAILAEDHGKDFEELRDEDANQAIVLLRDVVRDGRYTIEDITRLLQAADEERRRES